MELEVEVEVEVKGMSKKKKKKKSNTEIREQTQNNNTHIHTQPRIFYLLLSHITWYPMHHPLFLFTLCHELRIRGYSAVGSVQRVPHFSAQARHCLVQQSAFSVPKLTRCETGRLSSQHRGG